MLLSSFYNPDVECYVVAPWLQGALAVIDLAAQSDPLVIGRMFMDQQPSVAPLWVGVTVLGLQSKVLQDVRWDSISVDLLSAAWSGTMQSFIQQPISDPLVLDGHITRADQCRLLFLSQSGTHARVPICPWNPFGKIPLEHTDLEARAHASCGAHGLQYHMFVWDCTEGETVHYAHDYAGVVCPPQTPQPVWRTTSSTRHSVNYGKLDMEKDSASEPATRSIFGWLRFDGCAPDEKEIWNHEWLEAISESEEEEAEEEAGTGLVSGGRPSSFSAMPHYWIKNLCTRDSG